MNDMTSSVTPHDAAQVDDLPPLIPIKFTIYRKLFNTKAYKLYFDQKAEMDNLDFQRKPSFLLNEHWELIRKVWPASRAPVASKRLSSSWLVYFTNE